MRSLKKIEDEVSKIDIYSNCCKWQLRFVDTSKTLPLCWEPEEVVERGKALGIFWIANRRQNVSALKGRQVLSNNAFNNEYNSTDLCTELLLYTNTFTYVFYVVYIYHYLLQSLTKFGIKP